MLVALLSKIGPIAGLFAIATIASSVWVGSGEVRFLRIVGALIGAVALPLSFLPIMVLARRGKPSEGGSYLQTTKIVESHVFSLVRHPQYLSYILFMITFGLLGQSAVVTALAITASGFLYWSMRLEEKIEGVMAEQQLRAAIHLESW